MNSISYMKDNDKYKYQIYFLEMFINVSLPLPCILKLIMEVKNRQKFGEPIV